MTDEPFDYGPKKASGQYTNYPSKVLPTFVAPLRNEYIHLTCKSHTIMRGMGLVETYASNPTYYSGGTFCCACGDHFPLIEFRWCEWGEPTEFKLGETDGTPGEDRRNHASRGSNRDVAIPHYIQKP